MEDIKFNVKKAKSDSGEDIYSVEIYRRYLKDDEVVWGYIDSMHPMTINNLQALNNYLSQLIWSNYN